MIRKIVTVKQMQMGEKHGGAWFGLVPGDLVQRRVEPQNTVEIACNRTQTMLHYHKGAGTPIAPKIVHL